MLNLIKCELHKFFHKKTFYIITFIFIIYAVLTNFVYKNIDDKEETTKEVNIKELNTQNATLDLNNDNELNEYLNNLTTIEISNLKKEYKTPNQSYLLDNYLYDIILNITTNDYFKNNKENKDLISIKDEYLTHIKDDDWAYFTNHDIKLLEENLSKEEDTVSKTIIKEQIALNKYRLKYQIAYDNTNYLNNAIITLDTNIHEYFTLNSKTNLTPKEQKRLDELKEIYLTHKYILDHQVNINDDSSLYAVIKNFTGEFELFILIYIVMICGGLVSEEFNKGTIKYLLTKPYKRSTILLSKLLTALILTSLSLIIMILIELLLGSFILGFNTINYPVLIFNAKKSLLINISPLSYLFLNILANIPMYIILITICLALSTVSSTSAAITITFFFYLAGEIIRNLSLNYHLPFLKAFISLHWNFNYLITYTNNPFNTSIFTQIIIILIYLVFIISLTFTYFNKKDVKNI